MRKTAIFDRTLAAAKNAEHLSFKEKVEIARLLEAAGADCVEFHSIENEKTDTLLMRTVSAFIKNAVLCIETGMTEESIATAWEAIKNSQKPRLSVALPVSPVGMEYLCHKKAPKMLLHIESLIRKAVSLCGDVEFTALDATRAEKDFLISAIEAAINCGAKTVTVCDDEAALLPDEFAAFTKELISAVPSLTDITFAVRCDNSRHMALASSLLAVKSGVNAVTVGADAANTVTLDEISEYIRNCGDRSDIFTSLKYTEITRLSNQINKICGKNAIESVKEEASTVISNPNEIALTENDTLSTVIAAVKKLGYDLSDEDYAKIYESFKNVAEKKTVSDKELDAIVASSALQVPPTYILKNYVINTGNIISSSAQITLEKDGKAITAISVGDGPIDASFQTIEQIIGHHYELDDFQVQAVTEGREAMGSAVVKLRENGKLYSGNGISTDILGASIHAYISALNKITFEEN